MPSRNASLSSEWEQLSGEVLPLVALDSPWRHNAACEELAVDQGWKLHVSATVLSATPTLAAVSDAIRDRRLAVKGPRTLADLARLNAGFPHGFSQVGKFLTFYTRSPEEAREVGHQIDLLVGQSAGPRVPFEPSVRPGSAVHYRYGSFRHLLIDDSKEESRLALRTPEGELIPDERGPGAKPPYWASDPFASGSSERGRSGANETNLFGRGFLVYEALSQRGKGGVYRALDVRSAPARIVILKEGRRHGETGWDGRDGAYRVRRDGKVMGLLRAAGLRVPEVFARLRVGRTAYVAMEQVEGTVLQAKLGSSRLGVTEALRVGADVAAVIGRIHAAGWVWRDCKPANLIVTTPGVVPIDFEGAAPLGSCEMVPWTTPGYLPPDLKASGMSACRESDDIYALGVTIHQLLSGKSTPERVLRPIGAVRRGVPRRARDLIAGMLSAEAAARPSAEEVAGMLRSVA